MSNIKFKHNNVVFLANDEQVSQLKHKLLVTGVAVDVETYHHEQQDDAQPSREQHQDGGN